MDETACKPIIEFSSHKHFKCKRVDRLPISPSILKTKSIIISNTHPNPKTTHTTSVTSKRYNDDSSHNNTVNKSVLLNDVFFGTTIHRRHQIPSNSDNQPIVYTPIHESNRNYDNNKVLPSMVYDIDEFKSTFEENNCHNNIVDINSNTFDSFN